MQELRTRMLHLARPRGPSAFADLRRLEPVSRVFGLDRGLPVDRWYIERFLNGTPTTSAVQCSRSVTIGTRAASVTQPARRCSTCIQDARNHDRGRPQQARQPPRGRVRLHHLHADTPVHLRRPTCSRRPSSDAEARRRRIVQPVRDQPDQQVRHGSVGRPLALHVSLGANALRSRIRSRERASRDVWERADSGRVSRGHKRAGVERACSSNRSTPTTSS